MKIRTLSHLLTTFSTATISRCLLIVSVILAAAVSDAQYYNLGAFWRDLQLVQIYRSVGPGNTSILACGTSGGGCTTALGNLTISGTTATFATGVNDFPVNVGVGDAIVYDCGSVGTLGASSCIAFIAAGGRTGTGAFTIQTASGLGKPTSYGPAAVWRIYRAYTSIQNALTGNTSENSAIIAINSTLGDFDIGFNGNNNLVTTNTQWNIAVYGDAWDVYNSVPLQPQGWTTSQTNYLKIYAPYLSTDVGLSQRHAGYWQNTGVATVSFPAGYGVHIFMSNLTIDGIQFIEEGNFGGGDYLIMPGWAAGTSNVTITGNLLTGTGTASSFNSGGIANESNVTNLFIANNIIYNLNRALTLGGGSIYVYNNTVVNSGVNGLYLSGGLGTVAIKNNLITGSGIADYADNNSAHYLATVDNLSGDATSPNTALRSQTVKFANSAVNDFLLASTDTAAHNQGTNLSADANYPFPNDIQMLTRLSTWDIGASMTGTGIFRSVGVNSSPLACGATANGAGCSNLGNMTITGTTATFASALPNNVGVGDAVQYQVGATWYISFINGRTSSTVYSMQNNLGGPPQASGGAVTSWSIYRAYKSLANAIDSSVGGNENNKINVNVRSFDSAWSAQHGRNMVTNGEQWNFACYADAVDTTTVGNNYSSVKWVGSPANYLRVYTPYLPTEVGVSQRHNGTWTNQGYQLVVNTNYFALSMNTAYAWVDGLQISVGESGGAFYVSDPSGSASTKISNNIFTTTVSNNLAINAGGNNSPGSVYYIWNNIAYGFTCAASGCNIDSTAFLSTGQEGNFYVYNNTVANTEYILTECSYSNIYLDNNIFETTTSLGNMDDEIIFSNYNIYGNGGPGSLGANDQTRTAVSFVNAAANNYLLSPADTHAIGTAEDLSTNGSMEFTTDIKNKTRVDPWDIGADQAITGSMNDILIDSLVFTNLTDSSFTATVSYSGDANQNATVTFYYCDATSTPSCTATSGSSVAMTRSLDPFSFAGNVSALTVGHSYNYSVVAVDADGAYGTPISGTWSAGPTLNITPSLTVNEGSPAAFVTTLSTTSTSNVVFSWATSDGTATHPTNYASNSGTATIAAGATTLTLPNITTVNTGAGVETNFYVTLSSITGANAGTIVGTANIFNLTNGMVVSGLTTSNISQSGFTAQISFTGNGGSLGEATLYYCDATQSPGCSALSGQATSMIQGSGVFTATVSGLAAPVAAGDTLNLEVIAADTGGVSGSPLTGTVTLATTNSLNLGVLTTPTYGATTFTASATYTNDANNNGTVTLWYCNNTVNAGCSAISGPGQTSIAMTRGAGVFTVTVNALISGDTYNLAAVGADPNGVYNTPITTTVTLPAAPAAPTNMTATAVSSTEIDLSWSNGGGSTASYVVAYQTGSYPASCSSGTTANVSNTELQVTALTASTQYYFIVCAKDGNGNTSTTWPQATTTTLGAYSSRIFISSSTSNGNIGANGITSANAQCATLAYNQGIPGLWNAVISSQTVAASANILTGGGSIVYPIVRMDGTTVATATATLFCNVAANCPGGVVGQISNTISVTEQSATVSAASNVWTNTLDNTGALDHNTNNTTCGAGGKAFSSNAATNAIAGSSNSTTATWSTNAAAVTCSTAGMHIYCVDAKGSYTAPPPPPTNLTATPGDASVNLAWTSGGGTTSKFVIAYEAGATAPANCTVNLGGDTVIPAATVGAGSSYNVTGLTAGTQYSFRLCSQDNSADPTMSAGVTVTATPIGPTLNIANSTTLSGNSEKFVVSLSTTTTAAVTFSYATANATAVSPTNYTGGTGSATIAAGKTSTTINVTTINNSVPSNAMYFLEQLSGVSANAVSGNLTGIGTIVDQTNGISISNLTATATQSSITAQVNFSDDINDTAVVTLFYCDNTQVSGCNPLTYDGVVMTRGLANYTTTVLNLSAPGDVYNLTVVATDVGGANNSPLTTTVTLGAANAITISDLQIDNVTTTGFSAQINYVSTAPASATVKMWYCDDTLSSGCNPTSGSSVTMTQGSGVFTASASGLNTNDTYRVQIVATDANGVYGSPLTSVVTLGYSNQCQTITLDTHNSTDGSSGESQSTVAVALTNVTAGDLITCEVTCEKPCTINSVADTANGSYSSDPTVLSNATVCYGVDNKCEAITYFQNAAAGSYSVTATLSANDNYFGMSCQAWKGVATSNALDTTMALFNDGGPSPNPNVGTAVTPSQNCELIVSSASMDSVTPTAGANYTMVDSEPNDLLFTEYWVQTTATATNGIFTAAADINIVDMLGFKAGPAGTNVMIDTALATSNVTASSFTATLSYTGDANSNSAAELYYCNATSNPGCNPYLIGTEVSMTRGSGVYTVTVSGLTAPSYYQGNTINIAVVGLDPDGVLDSPLLTTVNLFAPIYRSVGPGNTAVLTCGGSDGSGCGQSIGNLTISGTTATFATSFFSTSSPNYSVGVGDAIIYDCTAAGSIGDSSCIAFISGMTSATTFTVQNAAGSPPTPYVGGAVWRIYRAYTSLSNALTGTGSTNSSIRAINANLGNFDAWSGGVNLVSTNQQWNIAMYGEGADGGYYNNSFDATWVTSQTDYLKIYAPYLSTDVTASQRHPGYWSNTAARISGPGPGGPMLNIRSASSALNLTIDGLEIQNTAIDGNEQGLYIDGGGGNGSHVTVSNNLIYRAAATSGSTSYGLNMGVLNGGELIVYNNIVSGPWNGVCLGITSDGNGSPASTYVVYNNTAVGCSAPGIYIQYDTAGSNILYLKNNLAQNNTTDFIVLTGGYTGGYTHANNLSKDASSPDASFRSKTAMFATTPNGTTTDLLSYADTVAKGQGANLSADPEYAFSTDIATHTRPASWSIGADEPATPIYRSVGPSNTSVLACGGSDGSGCANVGGNLTISGTTATFVSGLPSNIGVGDVIVYDSNSSGTLNAGDSVAFIVGGGRASSTSFTIQNNVGGTPTAYGPAAVWRVYRAYTSVDKALSGLTLENSAIVAINTTLGHFDSGWSGLALGSQNLVSSNTQWNIALYGDNADTSNNEGQETFNWVTSASNYLRIYAPYSSTDVGISQRHSGVWDNTKARSVVTNAINYDTGTWIWIDGLQMQNTENGSANGNSAWVPNPNWGEIGGWFSDNLVNFTITGGSNYGALSIAGPGLGTYYIWNNIINGGTLGGTFFASISTVAMAGIYIYNNTFVNATYAIDGNNNPYAVPFIMANNIAQSCVTKCYQTSAFDTTTGSTNNLSSDASAIGTNPQNSKTVTFLNSGNSDYRLSSADVVALGMGANLSADANLASTVDDKFMTHPATWSIGADEAVTGTMNNTFISYLVLTSITTTGFTATINYAGDADTNTSVALFYCDQTANPLCDPLQGTGVAMIRGAGVFTVSPTFASTTDTLLIAVVATDVDGVSGTPLVTTVVP